MKITAYFDSADSADFTAGAILRALPKKVSVNTESRKNPRGTEMDFIERVSFANIIPTYTSAMYTPVLYTNRIHSKDKHELDYAVNDNVLEVVCERNDAALVSQLIISHGGRNISKI